MIDKIIHQIWVGEYDIPTREKELSKGIKDNHPNYKYYLWTNENLPKIPERLQSMYEEMYFRKDYAFCADIIRWLVVYEYGGWFLDIDWEYIKNLDTLNIDSRDGILFGHWGINWSWIDYTFANNIFGFKKNHPMVKYVIENMKPKNRYVNIPFDPHFVGITIKEYMNLENKFSNVSSKYHRIVKENLNNHNIEYGDYNRFQNDILKHYALFSWSNQNKIKFQKGLIK